jgi:membrane protease YdiL (CAAX protease family)
VPWGPGDVALSLGLLFLIAVVVFTPTFIVAVLIAEDAGNLADDPKALAILLGANLVLEAALIGAALLFTVGRHGSSLSDLGFRLPRRGGFWLPFAVLFAAYFIIFVYFGIVAAIGVEELEPESTIPESALESPLVLPIVAVLALVFAPIMEETFFRGFLFGGLRGRWGVFLAALGTGFLFALAHVDPFVYIPFTAVGMIFAWGYVYSGSIFAGIIAHFLFNSISFGLAVSGVVT